MWACPIGVPGRGFPWPSLSGTLALVQYDMATAMQPVGRWFHLGPLAKWQFLRVERKMLAVLLEGSRPGLGVLSPICHSPHLLLAAKGWQERG